MAGHPGWKSVPTRCLTQRPRPGRSPKALIGPATLKLIGESAAGHGFTGALNRGETVRILTGAPVPEGADAVLMQEDAELTHVGPRTPGGEYLRRFWHPFLMSEELGDTPKLVRLMDRSFKPPRTNEMTSLRRASGRMNCGLSSYNSSSLRSKAS